MSVLEGWCDDVVEHVDVVERAKAKLRYAARLKPGWSASLPRHEARALLNELARLERELAALRAGAGGVGVGR